MESCPTVANGLMARFLLDEMLTAVIGDQLYRHGHDARAVHQDLELRSMPDEQVLELAAVENRILVTLNIDDFVFLDRAWKQTDRTHSGIGFLSNSAFPHDRAFIGAVVKSLDAAAKAGTLPLPDEFAFLRRSN